MIQLVLFTVYLVWSYDYGIKKILASKNHAHTQSANTSMMVSVSTAMYVIDLFVIWGVGFMWATIGLLLWHTFCLAQTSYEAKWYGYSKYTLRDAIIGGVVNTVLLIGMYVHMLA